MNRFTRLGPDRAGGPPQPARLMSDAVAVGEPYPLAGDTSLRQEIEQSLEQLAKERLLEAENQAGVLMKKARTDFANAIHKATEEAAALIAQARAEVATIREAAYEEGFKTGFAEGYNDATQQVQVETESLLQGAQVLVEGAHLAEKRVLKAFEAQAVALTAHLARKILRRELADAPETILHMAQQAVDSLYLSGKVQVVVNPAVLQEIRAFSSTTEQALAQMRRFEWVADAALDRDQVYIVGQDGCFDLSPEAQLTQLLHPLSAHLTLESPPADEPLPALAATDRQTPLAPPPDALPLPPLPEAASPLPEESPLRLAVEPDHQATEASSLAELPFPLPEAPSPLIESLSQEAETALAETQSLLTAWEAKPFEFPALDAPDSKEAG